MAKFQYKQAVIDAFKSIFRNYSLFAPLLISLVLFLLFSLTPIYKGYIEFSLDPGLNNIGAFLIFYVIFLIISFVIYGWIFNLVRQLMDNKKIDLMQGLKNVPGIALKLFLLTLLLFIFFIIITFIMTFIFVPLGLVSAASVVVGIILVVLFITILIIAGFILLSALMQIIPILILESQGVFKTIGLTYSYFRKNFWHSLKLFGITLLLSIIAYIPSSIVIFILGPVNIASMTLQQPFLYNAINIIAGIPVLIIVIWTFTFYCKAYKLN